MQYTKVAFLVVGVLIFLSFMKVENNGIIDLSALDNYANQPIPNYINKDNTPGNNPITDAAATLGRVLFYDKKLSVDNTISCASCHQQAFAFSDPDIASTGVNGTTNRHSMRLINARFGVEQQFFWDERANNLEEQTTQPIQDHAEMGFSGTNGDPDIDSLISKMEDESYYQDLFTFVYGDNQVTELRIQRALAQFIRSIQSFDSKYDAGRAVVNNQNAPFPNFTQQENNGKNLFMTPPQFNNQGARVGGGIGCQACHGAPEFDIVPNSRNNGFVGVIGGQGQDLNNERSPSLRDIFNTAGTLNSPLMHQGVTFNQVVSHYNLMPNVNNPNLDNRLRPGGNPQRLNMTNAERSALEAFIKTLSGTNVYTDPKWSDPFDPNGGLVITGTPPPPVAFVLADVRAMLEGPFTGTNLMDDALRAQNLIPITEPYTALGHTPVNHPGGESIVDLTVLNVTGPRAIVDWVFVQLLDKNDPTIVLATRSGLVRRDGRIVDMDGNAPLQFDNVGPNDYYVAVAHRNHLRVHTTNTMNLNATTAAVVGFVNPQNPIAPAGAMTLINNRLALWAGDASNDNVINSIDRSQIWNARNIVGYSQEDVELNGSCQAGDRSISWNNRNRIGM